jgi:hypothetical protein
VEYRFVKAQIYRRTAKAYMASLGWSGYASSYVAKEAGALEPFPVSQIRQIFHTPDGRQIVEVPEWLCRKNNWLIHEASPEEVRLLMRGGHQP